LISYSSNTFYSPVSFENEPVDAPWGERYFHMREADGYQLSFAEPT